MAEISSFPRICTASDPADFPVAQMPSVCKPLQLAFEAATGWVLGFDESRSSYRRRKAEHLPEFEAAGRIAIQDLSAAIPSGQHAVNRDKCDQLALAINQVFHQTQQYREELRTAHIQLAVPSRLALPSPSAKKIERLLNQLLLTATQQFGFESAAIFVLDDATSSLVQRASVGPHMAGSQGIGRLLADAKADVEALSGHVVVLSKRSETARWQAPIDCRSAVCLPISSLNNLHGTLWLFSDAQKEVNEQATNILEIIAGRIAAELECAALIASRRLEGQGLSPTEDDAGNLPLIGEGAQFPPLPFDGWHIECSVSNNSLTEGPEISVSWQVNSAESIQIVAAETTDPDRRDDWRLTRQAMDVLQNLDLDARQMHETLTTYLQRNTAIRQTANIACIVVDPLSGEFDFCADDCFAATIHQADDEGTNVHQCRSGFICRGNRLTVTNASEFGSTTAFCVDREN